MKKTPYQHIYPTIDILVDAAVREVEDDGYEISCQKGCDHCCHLLVEVSYEEAHNMALWIEEQAPEKKAMLLTNIKNNAREARKIFRESKDSQQHAQPCNGDSDIGEDVYDAYFYDKKRPCAFLDTNKGMCMAYQVRPSSCRLHLVTSPPELCTHEVRDHEDYEVPDRIEELRDEVAPINTAMAKKDLWGQLGIMVEAALKDIEKDKRKAEKKNKANKSEKVQKPEKITELEVA